MTGRLSVVVVSHDSWPYVGACIASVLEHAPAWMDHEIVLRDNASTDATVAEVRARFPSVRVLTSMTNDGYGTAVNDAVTHAVGDHLAFLNPDCVVTAGALGTLVRFLEASPTVGVVGPRLVLPDGRPQPSGRRFPSPSRLLLEVLRLHRLRSPRWRADHLLGTYWDQAGTRRVDWVSGACHVLRRDVWDRVGPLTEETFCGFDDFEYCWRADQLGLQTWLCAEATVVHHVGTSVRARWSPEQVDELAINNMFVLLAKHWPVWRTRLLATTEALVATSDWCAAGLLRVRGGPTAVGAHTMRRRVRQIKLLLGLASGCRTAVPRCDPSAADPSWPAAPTAPQAPIRRRMSGAGRAEPRDRGRQTIAQRNGLDVREE